MELRSHGIVPGVIQVPHGGQPIVQMCDAQPSGGYPKIGTVIEADLWRLGQAPIGSRIRFVETTWDEALARPRRRLVEWLARCGGCLDLYAGPERELHDDRRSCRTDCRLACGNRTSTTLELHGPGRSPPPAAQCQG